MTGRRRDVGALYCASEVGQMAMSFMKALGVAACVAAGVLGGMMASLVVTRRGYYALPQGLLGSEGDEAPAGGAAEEPFRELRMALLGKHRRQIARALGNPTTASVGFATAAAKTARKAHARKAMTFWQATTWYYPFDQKQKKAIAIQFVRDRAREVEFIGVPG